MTSISHSDGEQGLDGAPFVCGPVALGGLVERKGEANAKGTARTAKANAKDTATGARSSAKRTAATASRNATTAERPSR